MKSSPNRGIGMLLSALSTSMGSVGLSTVLPSLQGFAQGQQVEAQPVAAVASVIGKAFLLRGDKIPVVKGMKLYASDQIITSSNGIVKVIFADGSNFVAMGDSSLEIEDYRTQLKGPKLTVNSVLNLVRGKVRFFIKPRDGGHSSTVKTSNAVLGVRGTLFYVDQTEPQKTELVVVKGSVAIANPDKPSEEVLVAANQTSSVLAGKEPAKASPAPTQLVAELTSKALTLPDKSDDGALPDDVDLPPPSAPLPTPKSQRQGNSASPASGSMIANGAGQGGGAAQSQVQSQFQSQSGLSGRDIITPEFMVLPLGATQVTKTGVGCDAASLVRLRRGATLADPETLVIGREMASCEGVRDEVLFWLHFYHKARGEGAEAQDVARYGVEEKIPLDVRPERERILSGANEGRPADLKKKLDAKDPLYAQDAQALLVFARALARAGKFEEALVQYRAVSKIKKLKSDRDLDIEIATVQLLQGDFEKAESSFAKVLEEEAGRPSREAAERGLALARVRKLKPSGIEFEKLSFIVNTKRTADKFAITEAGFRSDNRWANVQVSRLSLSSPKYSKNQKQSATEISADKEMVFSSGVKLAGKAGDFIAGDKNVLIFDGGLSYVAPFGLSARASFGQSPFAKVEGTHPESLGWSATAIRLGFGFMTYADYGFETIKVDQFEFFQRHRLEGTVPLHRGGAAGDVISLKLLAHHESHPKVVAAYFSPAKETAAGLGFALTQTLPARIQAHVSGSFSVVSRTLHAASAAGAASTAPVTPPAPAAPPSGGESQLASQKRQGLTDESLSRAAFGVEYEWSRTSVFILEGRYLRADDQNLKNVYDEFGVEAKWEWRYGKERAVAE